MNWNATCYKNISTIPLKQTVRVLNHEISLRKIWLKGGKIHIACCHVLCGRLTKAQIKINVHESRAITSWPTSAFSLSAGARRGAGGVKGRRKARLPGWGVNYGMLVKSHGRTLQECSTFTEMWRSIALTMEDGNQTVVNFSEQVVVLFTCALSFVGSSLIILTFILWSDLRTTPRTLLVCLSVSDWLSAVSYAFGVWRVFRTDSLDCTIQGAISTFANSSSFFWTVAIAVYLYVFIVRSSQRVADSLVLFFHLVR